MNVTLSPAKKAWTIVRTVQAGISRWHAFNTVTGVTKPDRGSYDRAFQDIPAGEKHNYVQ